jgi:hypothetical protein
MKPTLNLRAAIHEAGHVVVARSLRLPRIGAQVGRAVAGTASGRSAGLSPLSDGRAR